MDPKVLGGRIPYAAVLVLRDREEGLQSRFLRAVHLHNVGRPLEDELHDFDVVDADPLIPPSFRRFTSGGHPETYGEFTVDEAQVAYPDAQKVLPQEVGIDG